MNDKLSALITNAAEKVGSLADLSRVTGIPYRTLQDWKAGKRKPCPFTEKAVTDLLADIIQKKN